MPEQVLTDCGIWIAGLDFAGVSNSVSADFSVETPESTTFASGGWRERAEGGLKTATFSIEGFYDDLDAEQFESLGSEPSVTVAPVGEDFGDLAYIIPVAVSAHSRNGGIGELLAMSYAAEGNGAPSRAKIFDVRDGIDTDVTSTRRQLGALSAAQTLTVWVHLSKISATGRVIVTLRSADTQGSTPNDEDTVTATETGLYQLTQAGAVTNDWWDLEYDVGGTTPEWNIAAAYEIG